MDKPRSIGDVVREDANRRLFADLAIIDWRAGRPEQTSFKPQRFSVEWEESRINIYSEIFGQKRLHVWIEVEDCRIRTYAYSDESDEPVILTIDRDKITIDDQQYS